MGFLSSFSFFLSPSLSITIFSSVQSTSIPHRHSVCTVPPNRDSPEEHPPTPPCRRTNTVHLFITRVSRSLPLSQALSSRSYIIPSTKPPPKLPRSLFTWGKESLYPLLTGREQLLSRNSRTDAPECCSSMLTTTNRESGAHRRSYGWNNRAFRGPPSSTIIVIVSSANSGGILPQWEGSIMTKGRDMLSKSNCADPSISRNAYCISRKL